METGLELEDQRARVFRALEQLDMIQSSAAIHDNQDDDQRAWDMLEQISETEEGTQIAGIDPYEGYVTISDADS